MTSQVSIFAALFLVSFAVAWYSLRPRTANKKVVKRLGVIYRAHNQAEVEMIELGQRARRLSDSIGDAFARFKFSEHLAQLILYAGREDTVGLIVLISLVCAAGSAAVASYFHAPLPVVALSVVLGLFMPYLWLRRKKTKRLKQFNEALPDATDLMARALRAGHSTGSSIEIVAEQSREPIAGEFGRCFQQQKFGIPFREALMELGTRVPSKDLQFLVTAILVQKETGGDLTQILDRTTNVIRERIRIEGEVRGYTAQGRLTGWILAGFPIAMMGLVNLLSPGYTHPLFAEPLGQKLLYLGGGLIVIGALIIRKIVDVKV